MAGNDNPEDASGPKGKGAGTGTIAALIASSVVFVGMIFATISCNTSPLPQPFCGHSFLILLLPIVGMAIFILLISLMAGGLSLGGEEEEKPPSTE